jgi:hypothetical protein
LNPFYSITSAFEHYENDVTRVETTPSTESFVKQMAFTGWFLRPRATADLSRPAFYHSSAKADRAIFQKDAKIPV